MKNSKYFIILILCTLTSCSVLQTVQNIGRLKYKIADVNDVTVAGINVEGKRSLQDFTALDMVKLAAAFTNGKVNLDFTIDINAKNPNDGTGGYPPTDISLKSFPWKLFINEKETIQGNISEPIFVPGVGESKTFSLNVNLELIRFFKNKSLEDLLNLVLNIGGVKSSETNLKLSARPVLGTPIGDMQYPDEITIVSYKYN